MKKKEEKSTFEERMTMPSAITFGTKKEAAKPEKKKKSTPKSKKKKD